MRRSQLDFSGRSVDLGSGRIDGGGLLRPMEAALLRYLSGRLGQVVPYEELLTEVWGYGSQVRTNTLHTTLRRLRVALEPDPTTPAHLFTVIGRGVRLVAGVPPTDRVAGTEEAPVGRAALLDYLGGSPPGGITVIGPSGVGKTRLVVEHARRAFGPIWFVDVSTATTAAEIATRISAPLAHRGPMEVILDGADDVHDLGPRLAAWIRASPDSRWIVTRRVPLGSEGERRLPVGPLALPASGAFAGEAAELLSRIVRSSDPSFDPRGSEAELGRLLALTDGLPLAIELAAPRVAALGPQAALEVLRSEGTLGAAIEGSWRGLPEGSRAVLAQLAAFAHPFTLSMASRVVAARPHGPTFETIVTALVERGLAVRAGLRFALLETVRARIGAPDPDAVERHLAVWAAAARAIDADADGLLQDYPLDRDDADEVVHAATTALRTASDPSLGALFELAVRLSPSKVADTLAQAVLASDPAPPTRVRLLVWWALRLSLGGRPDDARSLWKRLVPEALREGMPALAALVELEAAAEAFNAGAPDVARAALDRAERWASEIRSPSVKIGAYLRGRVAHVRGCLLTGTERMETMEQAVHEMLGAERPLGLALVRGNLSQALIHAGRFDEALRQTEAGLAECSAPLFETRITLLGLSAYILRYAGRFDEALARAEEACRLAEGRPWVLRPMPLLQRGWCRLELGQVDGASADADRARALAARSGHARAALMVRALDAVIAVLVGSPDLERRLSATFDATVQGRVLGAATLTASATADAWVEGLVSTDPLRLTTLLLEQGDLDTHASEVALLHAELLRRRGRGHLAIPLLDEVEARSPEHLAGPVRVARAALTAEQGDLALARRIVHQEARIPRSGWAALNRARCANALGLPEEAMAALAHVRLSPWQNLLRAALAEAAPGSANRDTDRSRSAG